MKVGVYYRNSDVRVEQRPVPAIGENDVLVKILASGLCGSDLLEWYRVKRAPLVLGHEPAGEIVEAGKRVERWRPGDRVFVTHHVPCDACRECRTGHETACRVFQTVNNFDPGGFSEYVRVSGRSLKTGTFLLPDEVSYEQGAFVEPLGTAVRALRTLDLRPAESLLVCGSGIAGLLMIKLAKALGAGNVIATDMSRYRIEKAEAYGAHATLASGDVPAFVRRVNDGRLADKVAICVGSSPAVQTGLASAERGGTVLLFAVPRPEERVAMDFNPLWRDDMTIKTCYGAAPLDNAQALELIRRRTVVVDDMVTHRFGIDQIGEAFAIGARPDDCLKVLVLPHGQAS
jgi:L-iditol 2-dehydrogenase